MTTITLYGEMKEQVSESDLDIYNAAFTCINIAILLSKQVFLLGVLSSDMVASAHAISTWFSIRLHYVSRISKYLPNIEHYDLHMSCIINTRANINLSDKV
jgi:hypothetical protein